MELQIGAKIKAHRTKWELTQEEVANHLGISFQAISKWERGEGYPDITMLPILAGYFDTSVDELLGMNEIAAQQTYQEICGRWHDNNDAGRHNENVALMRKALKDYPNDALMLVQLASSLEKLGGTVNLRESAAVQEQIIQYTRDSEIRAATMFNICFTYRKLGENEKAITLAKKLPNLYKARENALVSFLKGEDRCRMAKTALAPLKWSVSLHLNALAEETGNDGYRNQAEHICGILSEIEQSA